MRFVTKLVCAAVLAMPLVANALPIALWNTTGKLMRVCLGSDICHPIRPTELLIIAPMSQQSCGSVKPCVLTVDDFQSLPTPHAIKIALITFKYDDGILGIDKNPESDVDVISTSSGVTFQTKS